VDPNCVGGIDRRRSMSIYMFLLFGGALSRMSE
jgi:hypothetical protein